jgi:hypothetical protein
MQFLGNKLVTPMDNESQNFHTENIYQRTSIVSLAFYSPRDVVGGSWENGS